MLELLKLRCHKNAPNALREQLFLVRGAIERQWLTIAHREETYNKACDRNLRAKNYVFKKKKD